MLKRRPPQREQLEFSDFAVATYVSYADFSGLVLGDSDPSAIFSAQKRR